MRSTSVVFRCSRATTHTCTPTMNVRVGISSRPSTPYGRGNRSFGPFDRRAPDASQNPSHFPREPQNTNGTGTVTVTVTVTMTMTVNGNGKCLSGCGPNESGRKGPRHVPAEPSRGRMCLLRPRFPPFLLPHPTIRLPLLLVGAVDGVPRQDPLFPMDMDLGIPTVRDHQVDPPCRRGDMHPIPAFRPGTTSTPRSDHHPAPVLSPVLLPRARARAQDTALLLWVLLLRDSLPTPACCLQPARDGRVRRHPYPMHGSPIPWPRGATVSVPASVPVMRDRLGSPLTVFRFIRPWVHCMRRHRERDPPTRPPPPLDTGPVECSVTDPLLRWRRVVRQLF
jgi:hypothetical protein